MIGDSYLASPSCSEPRALLYLLSPRSRVLPQKQTGPQRVKKFSTFYGTRRFITAFTKARHLSLSWASSIQSISLSLFSVIHFNIIISPTRKSSKWSPSLTFFHLNPVCTSPFLHTCYVSCPSQSSWFDHPNNIWWWVHSIKLLLM